MSIIRKIISKSIKLAFLLAFAACIALAWYGWYESTPLLCPHSQPLHNVSGTAGMNVEYFEYQGADGVVMKACIVSPNTKGEYSPRQSRVRDLLKLRGKVQDIDSQSSVVLVATSWDNGIEKSLPYAESLTGAGYTCVLWDPAGIDGGRKYCTYGYRESDDVPFLIDAVIKKLGNDTRIAAFGKGFGAAALMLAAPKDERIRSLVSLDCFCILRTPVMKFLEDDFNNKYLAQGAFWLIDAAVEIRAGYSCFDVVPVDAARQLTVPVLLASTGEYPLATLDDTLKIYEALKISEDKRSVFVPQIDGESHETKQREHVVYHELKNGQIREQQYLLNVYNGDDELMAEIIEWLPENTLPPLPKVLLNTTNGSSVNPALF